MYTQNKYTTLPMASADSNICKPGESPTTTRYNNNNINNNTTHYNNKNINHILAGLEAAYPNNTAPGIIPHKIHIYKKKKKIIQFYTKRK